MTSESPAPASSYGWQSHAILAANLDHALFTRNLDKPVEYFRLIDDMETDLGWTASSALSLSYTSDRCRSGTRSLRLSFEQRNEDHVRSARAANGSFTGHAVLFEVQPFSAFAALRFERPQDWSEYTRISLWCYVHPTGNLVNSFALQFTSAGAPAGPQDPIAINYFADLREGEWNHLTWEISEFARDNVVDVSVFQPGWGLNFRDAESRLTYDLDDLRLEKVAAEPVSGWAVPSGRVSYSHIGYAVWGEKIALLGDPVDDFRVVDEDSGEAVATLPAEPVTSRRGEYWKLDFSSVIRPGRYRLEAGRVRTAPFPISARPLDHLVDSLLNGIYAMRCGFHLPGVHDACHLDVEVSYRGEHRSVAGGWHDAANLSQDPNNTHITVCALLDLADALAPHAPELAERALEEARWGLEWILRMRFGPGLRYLMGEYSYYTDGIPGNLDDVVTENVGSDTFKNLSAALAEVRGARALSEIDPALAARLLAAAREDFETVLRDRPSAPQEEGEPDWEVAAWQNEVGYMALVAAELARFTDDQRYAGEAARLGRLLLEVQEFTFVEGAPITGYFYEDAARTRILHEAQRTSGAPHSFEDGGPLAYQALCETFPDHPDWVDWYTGLLAYSEYYCRKGAEAAEPFGLVPAAVWRRAELDGPLSFDKNAEFLARHANPVFPSMPTPDLIKKQMLELYEGGAYLSAGQRLRTFPLYTDKVRHGSSAVHLTKAIGLGTAATLRNDPRLSALLARQVHWLTGANPFSRSLVYGVGYDWWQNFTVSLPNFVGGLSVGMNTYEGDAPAWGNNAVFPYKEVWIVSMARLAAVLARLPGAALVSGTAMVEAVLRHRGTGAETSVEPGPMRLSLQPGEYDVEFGGKRQRLALADGAAVQFDIDPKQALELLVETRPARTGEVRVRITVVGAGVHRLELRVGNADVPDAALECDLPAEGTRTHEFLLTMRKRERPWVLVVVPDGRVDAAVEAFGTAEPLHDLATAHP
ncbi:glycoside hydrolase family 9 protein [Lysobacter korlensis]|uniref:Glycoside hydrolase family 9 protein n=1 Tax=Lysobacter korlensis TaxID=553636 RepID=A0ABV6RX22_9GAMM